MSDDEKLREAVEWLSDESALCQFCDELRPEVRLVGKAVPTLLAERDALRAELAAVKARVHDAYLREPDEAKCQDEPTGDELLDRLRGIYTVPVNDGAGPLNGKTTFTRRFPTLPLNLEAAAAIVSLRADLAAAVARNVKLADAVRDAMHGIYPIATYTDSPAMVELYGRLKAALNLD